MPQGNRVAAEEEEGSKTMLVNSWTDRPTGGSGSAVIPLNPLESLLRIPRAKV